jgi:hypothetical protein
MVALLNFCDGRGDEVRTTCGSGWVAPETRSLARYQVPVNVLMPHADPPATAGGTDFISTTVFASWQHATGALPGINIR